MNITTNCEFRIVGNRNLDEGWLLTKIRIDITQNLTKTEQKKK